MGIRSLGLSEKAQSKATVPVDIRLRVNYTVVEKKKSLPSDLVGFELPKRKSLGVPTGCRFLSLEKSCDTTFREEPVSGSAETRDPLTKPGKPRLTFEILLAVMARCRI